MLHGLRQRIDGSIERVSRQVQNQAVARRAEVPGLESLTASLAARVPTFAVIFSGALSLVWFLHEALARLDSLQGTAWDLGFDQQVVWNIANGHGFYSSFAHANFLGQHF